MSSDEDLQQKLLTRITSRRASIRTYLKGLERRSNWLLNTSIVSTAVTTVLTAGPALGGTHFTVSTGKVIGTPDSNIWQFLCLAAMLLSLAAAITTGIYRSNDTSGRLEKTRDASVQLDRLQTLLELGQLTGGDAIKQYEMLITTIPFIFKNNPPRD